MNKFKIAFANIKKRKGSAITFMVMVLISALMLSISVALLMGINDFYDKKLDELNAPHFNCFIYEGSYKNEYTDFAKNYESQTNTYLMDGLYVIGNWVFESTKKPGTNVFISETELTGSGFYKPEIIDAQSSKSTDMIILPISFKSSGVNSGDKIKFKIETDYTFTVYGFYEDPICGSSTVSTIVAYVGDTKYSELKSDTANFSSWKWLMVRFEKADNARDFIADFSRKYAFGANEIMALSYDQSKMSALLFPQLMSMLCIMFSLIILVIAFIVVNFSIKSSISEDIANIGALKSIGYKSKALRRIQIIQYLLIAALGSVIGSVIFLFVFGLLGNIIASTSGLLWVQGINVIPAVITIAAICVLTLLIVFFATRKYKKITPVNALRQGESHHSFKRNPAPLQNGNMPLNLHLGVKRFFNSAKNSVTLCIVVALLTFVSLTTYIISYNLNDDRTAMTQMVGLELAEIWVQGQPGYDIDIINDTVKSNDKVKDTLLSGTVGSFVKDYQTFAKVHEDNTKLTTNNLVRGEHPKKDDETTIGAIVANSIGKDLWDMVRIEINGKEKDYYIVGITQGIGDGGGGCEITYNAMLSHNDEFKWDTIYVYTKDGADVKVCYNELKNALGSSAMPIVVDEQLDAILSSLGDPLSMISMLMIIIAVVVIAFVLYLIISALIRKQKKEFGIMKAMGYKTRHIILQLLISFLPSLLIGTAIGIVLGFIVTNPLLIVFFSSMGLAKAYFIIPAVISIVIGLAIFVASMLISLLISLRLRKISPIKLILAN